MQRALHLILIFLFFLAGCGRTKLKTAAARPVNLSREAAESALKEIEKGRAENREWLRSDPLSYLAAVDRIDFGKKQTLTIGSAADSDLRLGPTGIEPHHLKVTVDGDRFQIQAVDANARFRIKEEMKREATIDPSSIQVGRFTLRLSHQRFPAIVIFDPESPRLKEYKGLAYFPIDFSYRYELSLIRNPQPEKITVMSTRGNRRSAERVGWISFLVGKTQCRLDATRLLEPGVAESEVVVFFCDSTNGKETYELGRYVDLKKLENGKYLLDFNLAYNPACAFSDYYNCPIPPKSNTLQVAIRAGEMDSHYRSHSDERNAPFWNNPIRWASIFAGDLPQLSVNSRYATSRIRP